MMNCEMQEGLINWFRLIPDQLKSISAVENVCLKIWNQHMSDSPVIHPRHSLLSPLIRFGIVECYSNGQYGLSPSTVLVGNKNILLCNIPSCFSQNINDKIEDFGNNSLVVIDRGKITLNTFIKSGIPVRKFDLYSLLSSILPLTTIMNSWTATIMIDGAKLFYLNENTEWTQRVGEWPIGIYKLGNESYSQKCVLLEDNNWRLIPSRKENIDAYNIAKMWLSIVRSEDIGVKYDATKYRITIDNKFFPFLIERLLFINSMINSNHLESVWDRQYSLRHGEMKILKTILGFKK